MPMVRQVVERGSASQLSGAPTGTSGTLSDRLAGRVLGRTFGDACAQIGTSPEPSD